MVHRMLCLLGFVIFLEGLLDCGSHDAGFAGFAMFHRRSAGFVVHMMLGLLGLLGFLQGLLGLWFTACWVCWVC